MSDERDEIQLSEPADRPRGTMIDDLAPPRELRRPGHVLLALSAVVVAGASAAAVWWLASGSFEGEGLRASAARTEPSDTGRPIEAAAARERVYAPTGAIVPGVVYVESTPEGAEVRVNGTLLGTTPLAASHAVEGEKAEVELRKAGYTTWHGTAAVRSGGLRLEVGLEKR